MAAASSLTRDHRTPTDPVDGILTVTPRVDIFESAEEYLIVADVPGVDSDGVSLDLDRDELTLSARTPAGDAAPRLPGRDQPIEYRRQFVLPIEVDAEGARAAITAGVLEVHVPKAAAARPRRIAVQAG
jgi:HSP20 family molecular chaperone IbpA